MTSDEREELRRLRRENKVLRQERDILSKGRHGAPLVRATMATPGLQRTSFHRRGFPVHESKSGPFFS